MGDRIYMEGDTEVVVLEVRGHRVKLGFNAPGYLPIHRSEPHRCHNMEDGFPALEEAECAQPSH